MNEPPGCARGLVFISYGISPRAGLTRRLESGRQVTAQAIRCGAVDVRPALPCRNQGQFLRCVLVHGDVHITQSSPEKYRFAS